MSQIQEIHQFIYQIHELVYDTNEIKQAQNVSGLSILPTIFMYHEKYGENEHVERPFVVFSSVPQENNIAFWRTSGKSNNTEQLEGTWFPTFGLMDEEDTDLYGNPEFKHNIIKMQYVMHIFANKYRPHGKYGPLRFVSKELSLFLIHYNLYLWKKIEMEPGTAISKKILIMNEIIKKYNYIDNIVQTYFLHIWQIVLSLRLAISNGSQRLGLWSDEFDLYDFMINEWCPRYGIEIVSFDAIPVIQESKSYEYSRSLSLSLSRSRSPSSYHSEYNELQNKNLNSFLKKNHAFITIRDYLEGCSVDKCKIHPIHEQLLNQVLENNRKNIYELFKGPSGTIALKEIPQNEYYPSVFSWKLPIVSPAAHKIKRTKSVRKSMKKSIRNRTNKNTRTNRKTMSRTR